MVAVPRGIKRLARRLRDGGGRIPFVSRPPVGDIADNPIEGQRAPVDADVGFIVRNRAVDMDDDPAVQTAVFLDDAGVHTDLIFGVGAGDCQAVSIVSADHRIDGRAGRCKRAGKPAPVRNECFVFVPAGRPGGQHADIRARPDERQLQRRRRVRGVGGQMQQREIGCGGRFCQLRAERVG